MKALMYTLALIVGAGLFSGCAGNADNSRSGSKVQVYGTMDTGIGYQSRRISRD
ncbi:MAG: hypothetical protein ACTH1W_08920 [Advenella sp.]|uniref:hypothetical protein n=1 Tax=Advenella sp. S44 TaxID=1982755 RepID=UPI0013747639|nr:hypothetical protein [Advenella sp. S44]